MTVKKGSVLLFVFLLPSWLLRAADPDSLPKKNDAPLFILSAAYRMPVNKNKVINSGRGIATELGINPGRFISGQLVLGIYAGYGWRDNFYSTVFNKDFVNDYHFASREKEFSGLDSAVIYSSGELIRNKKERGSVFPGCGSKSFHNYSMYYGVVLKLPYRFFPVLKIYRGAQRTSFRATEVITKNRDYNLYEFRSSMHGIELLFKGAQLNDSRRMAWYDLATLSVYYETCNYSGAGLFFSDGVERTRIPLRDFLSKEFTEKYSGVASFGFRLGIVLI